MKRLLLTWGLATLVILGACSEKAIEPSGDDSAGGSTGGRAEIIPGQYIVVLNDDMPADSMQAVTDRLLGIVSGTIVGTPFTNTIKGFAVQASPLTIGLITVDPRVKFFEPDYRITLLPIFRNPQTPPPTPPAEGTQPVQPGVTRVGGPGNGAGKVAWIIDTGIDFEHADLNVDRNRSRNFVGDGKTADDGNGHGTHVAGILGAINNDRDVVGVAAGASLVALRALNDDGSGTYSGIISAIDYVAANASPNDVVNMSLGGPASNALDEAVRRASLRTRFILAAGNSSQNAGTTSPARSDGANIYTISAVDGSDNFASFSNFGNPPVDYAAPGVFVRSTKNGGGTVELSGTSMAAPHAAGVILLGAPRSNGTAKGDKDATPDPIISR